MINIKRKFDSRYDAASHKLKTARILEAMTKRDKDDSVLNGLPTVENVNYIKE